MTLAALAELEQALLALDDVDAWEGIVADVPAAELDIRTREVVPLTSDFATMGGSRPRTMF